MIKRVFDCFCSCLLLVLLSPIMVIIAVLLRIYLGKPVLFCQERPGLHGKCFKMVKFRTMRDLADESGEPLSDAARLTALGRFLRATSLDELPELWNVLKGNMSMVGPRPLLVEYLKLYNEEQKRRHNVKPGITGWAQINGRNALDWEEKFRLDLWYVDNQSFWLDLKILALTLKKVIKREGINHQGSATAEKFKGTSS
ncbi:sugar transferase [Legionella jordanis]|nr:sugar transferase [Legionella jordanis]